MGLCEVLFIVFLVLKLTGVIAWSWWAVTSPLWIALVIYVAIFLIIGGTMGIAAIFGNLRK